jgi:hypothetical protein
MNIRSKAESESESVRGDGGLRGLDRPILALLGGIHVICRGYDWITEVD